MSYSVDIKLEAADLELGENKRTTCPACGGGSSQERSLSITLGEDGVLKWQCFRAKCDLGSGANAQVHYDHTKKPLVKVRKKFEGKVTSLSDYEREWIVKNWGIAEPEHWYHTPEYGGRVAMSVRSPKFLHRGWVLRDIMGNATTKALTYIDDNEEGMSWYKTTPNAPTVIVEDIPSAVRASRWVNSCALLGTGIGLDRALEIAENSSSVIVALDQDATELSFRWAHKYALLWGDVTVLPLQKDIKDMNEDELKELLNERTTRISGSNQ